MFLILTASNNMTSKNDLKNKLPVAEEKWKEELWEMFLEKKLNDTIKGIRRMARQRLGPEIPPNTESNESFLRGALLGSQ